MNSIEDHLVALERAGDALARAAGSVSLDTPVPHCPGWCVRDLVRHTGAVHRWATYIVGTGQVARPSPAERDRVAMTWGPDAELIDWFRSGHRDLVATVRAAPDELSCYQFLAADSPRAFWARRQAHETTIHRLDAQFAAGAVEPVDPAVAADGVDELLGGFFRRREPPADGALLLVTATDVDRSWAIRLGAGRIGLDPGADPGSADCVLAGPSTLLYPTLWNRGGFDELTVRGDATVLDRWRSEATIRWG